MSKLQKVRNKELKIDGNIKKKRLVEKKQRIDRIEKKIKVLLILLVILFIATYSVLKIIYETGEFTITLDENLYKKSGLVMYEKASTKEERKILSTEKIAYVDNISVNWMPDNINEGIDGGAHNGENYIAYTFYLENQGNKVINYWYTTIIDDVIKNVDEAIRVMIYINDEKTIYAKANSKTGENEENTKAFYSEKYAETEQRTNMQPGEIDKFTLVIWIEGDDPDCLDNLIGGEIKMHMEITEEHIEEE